MVNRLNLLVAEIGASTNKQVLVIIDDLDKLDLGDVEKIFKSHIKALFQPAFQIIYTIPIASLRDAVLQSTLVSESNDQIVTMPVSKLFPKGERLRQLSPDAELVVLFDPIVEARKPLDEPD